MNMSSVRIASLHGKHLLAPRLKNATKFAMKSRNIELDNSLGPVMAAYQYQPVRNYFGTTSSAGVFEDWKHKNLSKMRLPICFLYPKRRAAMEFVVKRHNLKMGTQLEFVDLKKRGNAGVHNGKCSVCGGSGET